VKSLFSRPRARVAENSTTDVQRVAIVPALHRASGRARFFTSMSARAQCGRLSRADMPRDANGVGFCVLPPRRCSCGRAHFLAGAECSACRRCA
jgi:hypothetical protein